MPYSKKRVVGFVGQDALGSDVAATASYGELFATAQIADDVFEIPVTLANSVNADFSIADPKKPSDLGQYDVEVGRIFKIRVKSVGTGSPDVDITYNDASGDSKTLTLDAAGEEATFLACESGYVILSLNL